MSPSHPSARTSDAPASSQVQRRVRARCAAHPVGRVAIGRARAQPLDQRVDVARRHEPALDAVGDALRPAPTRRRDDGGSRAHRLLDHEPEAVAQRREREQIRLGVQRPELALRQVGRVAKEAGVAVDERPGQLERPDEVELGAGDGGPLPGLEQVRGPLPEVVRSDRQHRERSRRPPRALAKLADREPVRGDDDRDRDPEPLERAARERRRDRDRGRQRELAILAAPLPGRLLGRRPLDRRRPASDLLQPQLADRRVVRQREIPDPRHPLACRSLERPEGGVLVGVDGARIARPGRDAHRRVVGDKKRVVRSERRSGPLEQSRPGPRAQLDGREGAELSPG